MRKGDKMKFVKENKGVIIFYLMLAIFTFALIENAKIDNSIENRYVMIEE